MSGLLLLLLLLSPSAAFATDRYVDNLTSGCSTPTDTDYNPATRSCGTGSELVYNTHAAALAVDAACDNIYTRAGTYVESINNTIASGTAGTCVTFMSGYQGERPLIKPASYNPTFQACVLGFISPANNIEINHYTFDGTNCTAGGANIKMFYSGSGNKVSAVQINDVQVINTPTSCGILMSCDGCQITNNFISNNGDPTATDVNHTGCGIYNHDGIGTLVDSNKITLNAGSGIQNYPDAHQTQVTNNWFINNQANTGGIGDTSFCALSGGDNEVIRNNVCVHQRGHGIGVAFGTSTKINTSLDQNSLYCSASCQTGIRIDSGTNMAMRNNIVIGTYTAKINNPANATLVSNLTTGTATALWNDPANANLTLKTGSAAIDTCTNIGLTFNGTAPDCGAFESFTAIAASITSNTINLSLNMNRATPPQGTGTGLGAWTLTCSGTPCGTPVVATVSLFSGSSTILALTVTGFGGGNSVCDSTEVLTVSYNPTTGTVVDSSFIGNSLSQPMSAITNFPIDTSSCTGTPVTGYPSGALIDYALDGNATDSSGNGNNGTLNGSPTFVAAQHGQGMQTTSGANQFVAIPYGNGINPSTQAMTVCVGIYITPGTEGTVNFIAFGAPTGTSQRWHVAGQSGTWRLAAQSNNSGTASNLSIVPGWNFVCVLGNGAGTLTLYNNGVAGTTGSGVRTVTSYTLAGNFQLGAIAGNTSGPAIYDDFLLYTSVQSISAMYAVWQPSVVIVGTFSQVAHLFQKLYLTILGTVENLGVVSQSQNVIDGGAVALVIQINCDNVAPCDSTAFSLRYSTDCIAFNNVVPDIANSDGVYFWGSASGSFLNNGSAGPALTGGLATTQGPTQVTSAATPTVTLSQNTSLTLRYLVKFMPGHSGSSFCFKAYRQTGEALNGTYAPTTGAKVNIVDAQAAPGA